MAREKKRKWIIYMYTFPNGKRYIGKTHTSLKDRQGGINWSGYKHSSVLMKAVKKYGIENIKQEILFEDEVTDEYASRLEQICILLFKVNCLRFTNPAYGYNMTDGGEETVGRPMSEESKKKMSNGKKGRTGDAANSSKPLYCIELNTIFPNGVYAEIETGVSRKSISQALHSKNHRTCGGNTGFDCLHWEFSEKKPRPNKDYTPKVCLPIIRKRKGIYCIELGEYFESAQYASSLGYGAVSSIQACCNGSKKHAMAADGTYYHWLYEEDVTDDNIAKKINDDIYKTIIKQDGSVQQITGNSVYCIELDMYFLTPDEAEKQGYGKKRNIMANYRGVSKFTKLPDGAKVHWLLAKDVCEENIIAALNNNPQVHYGVPVYCLEQDKSYLNEREADRQNGFPDGYVARCVNGYVPEDKLKNGLHWVRQ